MPVLIDDNTNEVFFSFTIPVAIIARVHYYCFSNTIREENYSKCKGTWLFIYHTEDICIHLFTVLSIGCSNAADTLDERMDGLMHSDWLIAVGEKTGNHCH